MCDRRPDAIVVGAGLAGCAAAYSLAARGASVTVVDAAPAPASGASGNVRALALPYFRAADGPLTARYALGLRLLTDRLHRLAGSPGTGTPRFSACGAVQVGSTPRLKAFLDPGGPGVPAGRAASPADASREAGCGVGVPALVFPGAVAVDPRWFCRAQLRAAGAGFAGGVVVQGPPRRSGRVWRVSASGGDEFEAPVVVLAAATASARLAAGQGPPLRLRPVSGQVAAVRVTGPERPRTALCYDGYLVPPDEEGVSLLGATYVNGVEETTPDPSVFPLLSARLGRWFPGVGVSPLSAGAFRSSVRAVTPTRAPYAGPVGDDAGLFVSAGHGSRGLVSAVFAGEEIAGAAAPGETLMSPAPNADGPRCPPPPTAGTE